MDHDEMQLDALLDEVDLARVLQNLVRDRREELSGFESKQTVPCTWRKDIAEGDNLDHGLIDVFEDFQQLVETRLQAELDTLGWTKKKFIAALHESGMADNLVLVEATSDIQVFARILRDEIDTHDKVAEETKDLW